INCLSHSSASNTQYLHGQKEKPSQRSHQTGQVPFNACAAVFWHGGPSEDLLSQEIPLPLDMGKGGFQWGFYGNTEPEELAALCVRGQRQQVLEVLSGDIVKVASSQLDATGASALHLAVLGGHLVFTQELIAASCDVNARDHQDKTPLHIASAEGYAELALELLVAGAGANDLDSMGQTPLHAASFTENLDLISVLLDHGVDPTLRDAHGRTAAFIAAEKGKISFLSLLLEKEPGLALIPNNEFWTPLHVAAWGMQSVKNFTRPLKFLESLKLLLTAKAEADAKDENCCTPMHRAAQAGNSDTLQALLQAGAQISMADECRIPRADPNRRFERLETRCFQLCWPGSTIRPLPLGICLEVDAFALRKPAGAPGDRTSAPGCRGRGESSQSALPDSAGGGDHGESGEDGGVAVEASGGPQRASQRPPFAFDDGAQRAGQVRRYFGTLRDWLREPLTLDLWHCLAV
ncbi:unnamed protein product, partial [Effrenium voratum]